MLIYSSRNLEKTTKSFNTKEYNLVCSLEINIIYIIIHIERKIDDEENKSSKI
jgi:hypothetical protein